MPFEPSEAARLGFKASPHAKLRDAVDEALRDRAQQGRIKPASRRPAACPLRPRITKKHRATSFMNPENAGPARGALGSLRKACKGRLRSTARAWAQRGVRPGPRADRGV